jgi:hypothetical protein
MDLGSRCVSTVVVLHRAQAFLVAAPADQEYGDHHPADGEHGVH